MANCLTALTLACDSSGNMAGIARLWLTSKQQILNLTFNATGQVSGITMLSAVDKFQEFQFDEDTAYLNQTLSVKNKNTTIKQAIKMNHAKMDTTKRNALMTLISCSLCGLVGIVLDNNNKFWFVGILKDSTTGAFVLKSLKVVSGSGNTGADSENDFNGFETMLEAKNGEYAREWTLGVAGIPV